MKSTPLLMRRTQITPSQFVLLLVILAIVGVLIVSVSTLFIPSGQGASARPTATALAGQQVHTECYVATAGPGVVVHEEISYDGHGNILARKASTGGC